MNRTCERRISYDTKCTTTISNLTGSASSSGYSLEMMSIINFTTGIFDKILLLRPAPVKVPLSLTNDVVIAMLVSDKFKLRFVVPTPTASEFAADSPLTAVPIVISLHPNSAFPYATRRAVESIPESPLSSVDCY